jgi:hypothetical protein
VVENGKSVNRHIDPSHFAAEIYSSACVICLLRYHMPHAPLGIFNVPFVAGDEVNMDMENALPSRGSDIDSDVVAIRMKYLVKAFLFLFNEAHTGRHFFRRQVEKTGYMPTWDD